MDLTEESAAIMLVLTVCGRVLMPLVTPVLTPFANLWPAERALPSCPVIALTKLLTTLPATVASP